MFVSLDRLEAFLYLPSMKLFLNTLVGSSAREPEVSRPLPDDRALIGYGGEMLSWSGLVSPTSSPRRHVVEGCDKGCARVYYPGQDRVLLLLEGTHRVVGELLVAPWRGGPLGPLGNLGGGQAPVLLARTSPCSRTCRCLIRRTGGVPQWQG